MEQTITLNKAIISGWADTSEQEKWEEYERRKRDIKKKPLSRQEYERRVAELVRELKI